VSNIWLASGNLHKKKELAAIFRASIPGFKEHELKIPLDACLDFKVMETGTTFHENALIKAHELHRLLNENNLFNARDAIIADDSGICVDALAGRPGIYSARYSGPPGCELKNELNDRQRNLLLLDELKNTDNRFARFVCAMVLLFSENNLYIAMETLEGSIIRSAAEMCGTCGFGYDPVFFIPEAGKSAAELTAEEKNAISHRGKAGRVIAGILEMSRELALTIRTN
jgi:XTP/dITP diphosphohydrolase